MKFGVWYGMAAWFLILKGLDLSPFAEWPWSTVLVPIVWPSLPVIKVLMARKGRQFAVFVQSLGQRKHGDAAVSVDPARKQS